MTKIFRKITFNPEILVTKKRRIFLLTGRFSYTLPSI